LSNRQWARIDPENGAPWLFAAEADTGGQPSATIDEVPFQLARVKRVASELFSVDGEICSPRWQRRQRGTCSISGGN